MKAQFDFATGIQAVITAVLTSPRFLFVLEFGAGGAAGGVALLSPSRSPRGWRSSCGDRCPTPPLMQAAAAGQLATPDQIEAQAVRMLADDQATAQDALSDFATQWLELQNTEAVTKDTQFAPGRRPSRTS